MLYILVDEKEQEEIEYLIKRELEMIIEELSDRRIQMSLEKALIERSEILLSILKRTTPLIEQLYFKEQIDRTIKEK